MPSWSSSLLSKLSYSSLRDAFASIGRSIEPRNLERKILLWSSSAWSYIEANPIIFSVQLRNDFGGETVQTYVNLPYLGAISLDAFLFSSLAIISRAHMFWKRRRQVSQITRDSTNCEDAQNESLGSQLHRGQASSPVKSTIVEGYKDKGLYKTIRECQSIKNTLRRVADPELARKEKKRQLALQNARTKIKGKNSSDGYLGMSPARLQDARRCLKKVTPDHRQL